MSILSWLLVIGILSGQLIKFSPSGRPGAIILDLVLVALVAIGLYQMKLRLITPDLILKTSLAFLGIGALSLMLYLPNLNLLEFLLSLSYAVRFLIFVLLAWIIKSKGLVSIIKNFPKIILISGFGLSILGLLQLMFFPNLSFLQPDGWDPHYFRSVATFLDPNFLGGFLAVSLLLGANSRYLFKNRYLYYFSLVTIYLAFITTFSRSAALNLAVSFLAFTILTKSRKFFALTLALCLGFYLNFQAYTVQISSPRNIDRSQSAKFRLESWQQGFKIWQNYPLLGVGFNSYQFALKKLNLVDEQYQNSRGATTNDSSLLYVAATTGIIGLSIYLYLIYSLLKISLLAFQKTGNHFALVYFSSILGLVAHSFFSNILYYPFILLWIFLGWSHLDLNQGSLQCE